jgi:hypothetical protein
MWDDTKSTCKECGEFGHAWMNCEKLNRVNLNFGEEPLEPYSDWNLTSEPGGIEITTRAQRRKIMDENKFEYRKKSEKYGGTMYFDQKGR